MSGFSADWLHLREPVDARARDLALIAHVAELLAGLEGEIVDLGCGTGSNLRTLAPSLGPRQSWTLVDKSPDLLEAARKALVEWADVATRHIDDQLILTKDGCAIEVAFRAFDLALGIGPLLELKPVLVTASALFDLASPEWIERVCAALIEKRIPLYAALTYDGIENWSPPRPEDSAMLAAFHAHQHRDKGFGPAAGPEATALMIAAFAKAGWRVETAPTPWRLGANDRPLIQALADGSADAVAETGLVDPAIVRAWRADRRFADSCVIGHVDLLAWPQD